MQEKEMYFAKNRAILSPIALAVALVIVGAFVSRYEFWSVISTSYVIVSVIILVFMTIVVRQDFKMFNATAAFKKSDYKESDGRDGKRKVFLVSGFSGGKSERKTGRLIGELGGMGLEVRTFEHMPQGILYRLLHARSIEEFAYAIYPHFAKLQDQDVIIGYSMGCLIVRFILEVIGIKAKPTVILVGGPHCGCRLWLLPFFLVPCIREMFPWGSTVQGLGLPTNEKYWYFVAPGDGKVSMYSACPVQTGRKVVCGRGHRMLDNHELVAKVQEIITTP